jgi:hypothetical protein
MNAIYGDGFPEHERKAYIPVVYSNVIMSMEQLISFAEESPLVNSTPIACTSSLSTIRRLVGTEVVDETLANHIDTLWKDPAIQLAYEHGANFLLTDSARYFFERLTDIGKEDYIPTQQDVLCSRVRTTGIVENDYCIEGQQFKIMDVGGQRNERKKWIHCFDKVTAVLFVGVLSEYNMKLIEDDDTNRMQETLSLFEEVVNARWFANTAVILFLNKKDIFAEKIQKFPLSDCPLFSHHQPELINNYDGGCEAIRTAFFERNKDPDRTIYDHITCATDTTTMKVVLAAVQKIVIEQHLADAGLL